ncbi:unnamed protein product [Calypogeia fissa]
MGTLHRSAVVLALMLTASVACCGASGGRPDQNEGLELSKPEEFFRSEGGKVEIWSPDHRALQEAQVAADRITLEPRGLALFKYSEAPGLAYVLEGQAKIGLSYPWEESAHVRTVKRGEVIAIPRGIGHWCYNDGDQRTVLFRVSDTSDASEPSDFEEFYLHGGSGKEGGSVLQGFDEELLSQAWDVDRDIVRQIRESQKGTRIVRLNEDIDILRDSRSRESGESWTKFTYNIDDGEPDVEVKNGGTFNLLTEKSFPILKELKLSAMRVKLDKDAMLAPSYSSNMDGVMYVTKGSARVQVVGSDKQLLDSEVGEGSAVMIPQFHPTIVKAGRDGMEFILIGNSEKPRLSFLAGKNAVYRNIPVEVLAAGNNVPVEVEQKIRERRQNDLVIFPPRGRDGKEAITKLRGLFFSQFEDLKSGWDSKLRTQV